MTSAERTDHTWARRSVSPGPPAPRPGASAQHRGRAEPGTTVHIADDGEVLAREIGVFRGYGNPEADAEAFVEGSFRTGDLGSLDDAGRLTLHGRVKDVIVTSAGKTVSPAGRERYVEREPMVAHAKVVGEGKPYLGGVVLLDPGPSWPGRSGTASRTSARCGCPPPGRRWR